MKIYAGQSRRLIAFMIARHEMYLNRKAGHPAPWSDDPILRRYRFTNVYRELDRTTEHVDRVIRRPLADHKHLWFNIAVARTIGRIDSIDDALYDRILPTSQWNQQKFMAWAAARKERGLKTFTAAYLTMAVAKRLGLMWELRKEIEPQLHGSMEDACNAIRTCPGWGRFMSYELTCDMRFTRYLRDAPDVDTWTSNGPGSMRGLNRVTQRPLKARWHAGEFIDVMLELQSIVRPQFLAAFDGRLPAVPFELRELEHSLCEFDKYERARTGEGAPKQIFKPRAD